MMREKKFNLTLKPETVGLLKRAALLMSALYGLSLALFCAAGTVLDYQVGLIWSEGIMTGLRSGFGLLCLGFLVMECR